MRSSSYMNDGGVPSPGRALLYGIGAGLGVLFLGTWLARGLGGEGSSWNVALMMGVLPLLAAPVAAGVTAAAMGSRMGRAVALALLAFLGTFFLTGLMEYQFLVSISTWSEPAQSYWTGEEMQRVVETGLRRWHLTVSISAIAIGVLLGMMFGRPSRGLQ